MSLYSITNYYNELEKIIHYGGSKKETAIRNAFYNLLNDYVKSIFLEQVILKIKNAKPRFEKIFNNLSINNSSPI